MEGFLISTGVVALAEIGDKTQLLALLLATRFRKPVPIVLGILVATLANHAFAGAVGAWLTTLIGASALRWILGVSFIAMGVWALWPDAEPEHGAKPPRFGVFVTTLVAFFLVEMGDKTQLATVALAARFDSLVAVVLGTTCGMMIANVPVVFFGDAVTKRLPMRVVRAIAAALFVGLGVYVLLFTEPAAAQTTVARSAFGSLPDGTAVESFTLTNASGASVTVLSYGGIVASIRVPDRDGKLDDVVLGYDTLDGYVADSSYYGAIVGRYGNRIAGARFALDGRTYELAADNGPNSLHGGLKGFDRAVWHAEPFERDRAAGVVLTHTSPDGDEGFPGALSVIVTYTFDEKSELAIDYRATTDKATVLNLTNHSYFNLGGAGSGDVREHRLTLNADRYTPVDETLIPVGELASVAGTPLDFRTATAIGARIDHPGLKPATGYDHNYVINRGDGSAVLAARVADPKSGRVLEVLTTEPGVQLYTANHLDGSRVGRGGHVYDRFGAFCLETQHYPDSPNRPAFPPTTLRPGETFTSRTVYAFSVEK